MFELTEERAMTKVVADITMSLDGFVTGPNAGPTAGLGEEGCRCTTGCSTVTRSTRESSQSDGTQRSGGDGAQPLRRGRRSRRLE